MNSMMDWVKDPFKDEKLVLGAGEKRPARKKAWFEGDWTSAFITGHTTQESADRQAKAISFALIFALAVAVYVEFFG